MSAVVYRDRESRCFRAVCRDARCRQDNAQRNYWRTGHLSEKAAQKAAREHDQIAHPDAHAGGREIEHALRARPATGFDVDGNQLGADS